MHLATWSQHTQKATLENPVPTAPVASIHTRSTVLSCGFDIILDTPWQKQSLFLKFTRQTTQENSRLAAFTRGLERCLKAGEKSLQLSPLPPCRQVTLFLKLRYEDSNISLPSLPQSAVFHYKLQLFLPQMFKYLPYYIIQRISCNELPKPAAGDPAEGRRN